MTKQFTVKYGDQTRTIEGPDDATQEQAQQIADTHRDMSGETAGAPGTWANAIGKKVANFAQGGAELGAAIPQLMGGTPGPNFQAAENAPHDFGDSLMRVAGSTLPLMPLGGGFGGKAPLGGPKGAFGGATAQPIKTMGRGVGGRFTQRTINPYVGATAVPHAVGAVEGASAPADSQQERVINAGVGSVLGGVGRGSAISPSLDRLAGSGMGAWLGSMVPHWSAPWIGASVGGAAGPALHQQVGSILSRFPPSVIARALVGIGHPVAKAIADEYNAMYGNNEKP